MAVVPFDNLTPEPTLTQEINRAVREAVEQRLGLRPAGEQQADAVVTGSIQRYDPDMAIAFTAGQTDTRVTEVTKRMVIITVNVTITSQADNKILWEKRGLTVQGEYDPGREIDGRRRALETLVNDIVDGAQSQW